jgi:dynein intermediate chain
LKINQPSINHKIYKITPQQRRDKNKNKLVEMDFETQRKKRQEALDEKRKRLEEMKKKKESKAFEVPMVISPPSSPVKISTKESDDALLNSLLSHSKTEFEKQIKSPSPVVNDKVKLVTVKGNAAINIFPIPPMTTYSKMVQTEEDSGFLPLGNNHDFHVSNNNSLVTPAKNSVPKQSEKKVGGWGKLKGHIVTSTKVETPNFEEKKVEVDSITKVLSEEEKKNIINSKDFSKFLNFSSLIIERALNQIEQTSDIVRNYSHDQNNTVRKLGEIKPLEAFTPYEEEALKHRPIMDVKYSSIVSGLFLATYGSKNLYNNQIQTTARGNTTSSTAATTTTTVGVNYNINDDDNAPGMLCIWSKALHKRPEFKFIASSPVLTGIFHNADQYLVLGGCYNGQILLWDMRNGRSLPVQRSNLAGKGHKHPVYAMSMISVAVANQLVSVSTDGLICQWDISRLSEPHTISHLNIPTASLTSSFSTFLLNGLQEDPTSGVTSPLNVSCMSFFGNNDETPSMMFGSGAGVLYKKSLNLKSNEPIQPVSFL